MPHSSTPSSGLEVAFSILYTHKHNSMPKHISSIQFSFLYPLSSFTLCRDFYFMKCFDSTIFKLSWSKCIKCNDDLPRSIPPESLQVDQKCINFIFMASGKTCRQAANSKHEKRMPDVFILLLSRSGVNFLHIKVRRISTNPWASSKIYGEKCSKKIKWNFSFRSIGSALEGSERWMGREVVCRCSDDARDVPVNQFRKLKANQFLVPAVNKWFLYNRSHAKLMMLRSLLCVGGKTAKRYRDVLLVIAAIAFYIHQEPVQQQPWEKWCKLIVSFVAGVGGGEAVGLIYCAGAERGRRFYDYSMKSLLSLEFFPFTSPIVCSVMKHERRM